VKSGLVYDGYMRIAYCIPLAVLLLMSGCSGAGSQEDAGLDAAGDADASGFEDGAADGDGLPDAHDGGDPDNGDRPSDGDQGMPADGDLGADGDQGMQFDGDGGMDAGDAADLDGGTDGGADGGDADKSFSVLTINLKHPLTGMETAQARLAQVAEAINDREPDVVALQEVIKDGEDPDFAEQLGSLTGYNHHWEHTFDVPLSFSEGIGILSRWPILATDSAELPHLDLVIFRRKVLGARVDSPHGEIWLFCSHMTTSSDETEKADQALAVYQFIEANPSALPGFMAGDLNAEPDTLAMRFLRGEAGHEGQTGDLIDAWPAANPGQDGFTIPSGNPDRRIDYIYIVGGQESTAAAESCELMFEEPVDGEYASDHLGILCIFRLQ